MDVSNRSKGDGAGTPPGTSSRKGGSWSAERNATAQSHQDLPRQVAPSHQQESVDWNCYDREKAVEPMPAPETSLNPLARWLRRKNDERKSGQQLQDRRIDYEGQLGWGEFEDRPTKQERLAHIDRHLYEAKVIMDNVKPYISDGLWREYERLSRKAAKNREAAISSERGSYVSWKKYKSDTEMIMSMAEQLKVPLESVRWREHIDKEKDRIAETIDPTTRRTWDPRQNTLYDILVKEGQEELETFRKISPDKRYQNIGETYSIDIKVEFGLLKDEEWTRALAQLLKREQRFQKEARKYLAFCKAEPALERMQSGKIRQWLNDRSDKSPIGSSGGTPNRSLVEEIDQIMQRTPPDSRKKIYRDIREITIEFRKMRDVLAKAWEAKIPPTSVELGQFGILGVR